ALEIPADQVLGDESLTMLEGAEALAVEIVHHPKPRDLSDRLVERAEIFLAQSANRDGKTVGGGIFGAERGIGAAQVLEPKARFLHLDLGVLYRDQLFGAALLVLEPAKGNAPARQPEPLPNLLHGFKRGELLLVHQVDAISPARGWAKSKRFGDPKILWALFDPHIATFNNPTGAGKPPSAPGGDAVAEYAPLIGFQSSADGESHRNATSHLPPVP